MSWNTCMAEKILDHYGHEAKECAKSFSKADLEGMAKCIAQLEAEASEVEILKHLTMWSVECAL